MKIPFLKKQFRSLDILFVLFVWFGWNYLYGAYSSGMLRVRVVNVSRGDDPLIFWTLFCVMSAGFIYVVYLILFEEFPPSPAEYDHHGNIDR